ncbi:hypothetical protein [Paraburkholderia hospita]|uniref:hypothetical protein n=1 Tax=Paraburkholderia hospita TaxID=169430 RepID=UPI000B343010|nr:hypothetical protein [Paraburkholderia hospita]OUL96529.1 hypothetical protein CA603_05080 [Paraburkholderia hospita]
MATLRKYASRDRSGDLQVIDEADFFDPNRWNLHQKDDYPDFTSSIVRAAWLAACSGFFAMLNNFSATRLRFSSWDVAPWAIGLGASSRSFARCAKPSSTASPRRKGDEAGGLGVVVGWDIRSIATPVAIDAAVCTTFLNMFIST